MNYKKLTEGLSVRQFNEMAENWYARLNNLKTVVFLNDSTPKAEKARKLVITMIDRMTIITRIYIQVNKPIPPKSLFEKGGMTFMEQKK